MATISFQRRCSPRIELAISRATDSRMTTIVWPGHAANGASCTCDRRSDASQLVIVSGDKHLHTLGGQYQGIPIVRPAEAVLMVAPD